jgi:hypothetical protein
VEVESVSFGKQVSMATIEWLLICGSILITASCARTATSFNAQSAVGINLASVNYYSTEQPIIGLAGGWAVRAL